MPFFCRIYEWIIVRLVQQQLWRGTARTYPDHVDHMVNGAGLRDVLPVAAVFAVLLHDLLSLLVDFVLGVAKGADRTQGSDESTGNLHLVERCGARKLGRGGFEPGIKQANAPQDRTILQVRFVQKHSATSHCAARGARKIISTRSRMKVASALVASLCALGALGHTQEEIDAKGAEVMEEYRKDAGHWRSINDVKMLDRMVDVIGVSALPVMLRAPASAPCTSRGSNLT